MTMIEIDFSEVEKNLEKLSNSLPDKFATAVKDACLLVETEAAEKAPVDTGYLKGSITNKVVKNGSKIEGYVYTPVEYAPHVELGTHKTKAKPFLYPALTENQSAIRKIFNEVLKNDVD